RLGYRPLVPAERPPGWGGARSRQPLLTSSVGGSLKHSVRQRGAVVASCSESPRRAAPAAKFIRPAAANEDAERGGSFAAHPRYVRGAVAIRMRAARSGGAAVAAVVTSASRCSGNRARAAPVRARAVLDRKSTRLNSSHVKI